MRDDRNGTHPPAASPYAAALEQVRRGTAGAPVVVFDLDGVVRAFDNVELEPSHFEVTPTEIEAAIKTVEPRMTQILRRA